MAFLCPARVARKVKKHRAGKAEPVPPPGRITGSTSIDTLVQVGLERENADLPERRLVVLRDFAPCVDDELTVVQGDHVKLLYQENDWLYVVSENGKEGFVPNSYCVTLNSSVDDLTLNRVAHTRRQGRGSSVHSAPALPISSRPPSHPPGYSRSPRKILDGPELIKHVRRQTAINRPLPNNHGFSTDLPARSPDCSGCTSPFPAHETVNMFAPKVNGDIKSGVPEYKLNNYKEKMLYESINNFGHASPHSVEFQYAKPRKISVHRSNEFLANGSQDDIKYHPDIKPSNSHAKPFQKLPQGKYIVLYKFEAIAENDVSVTRGEFVTLLNRDDPEWCWVIKGNRLEGFVPSTYICPAEGQNKGFGSLNNVATVQEHDKFSSSKLFDIGKAVEETRISPPGGNMKQLKANSTRSNMHQPRQIGGSRKLTESFVTGDYSNDFLQGDNAVASSTPFRPHDVSDTSLNNAFSGLNLSSVKYVSSHSPSCVQTRSSEMPSSVFYSQNTQNTTDKTSRSSDDSVLAGDGRDRRLNSSYRSSPKKSDTSQNIKTDEAFIDSPTSYPGAHGSYGQDVDQKLGIMPPQRPGSPSLSRSLTRIDQRQHSNRDFSRSHDWANTSLPVEQHSSFVRARNSSSSSDNVFLVQNNSISGATYHAKSKRIHNIRSPAKHHRSADLDANRRSAEGSLRASQRRVSHPGPFAKQSRDSCEKASRDGWTKYVMVQDYSATYRDAMSGKKGEIVLADPLDSGHNVWVWCYSPRSERSGYLPRTYLQPLFSTAL